MINRDNEMYLKFLRERQYERNRKNVQQIFN